MVSVVTDSALEDVLQILFEMDPDGRRTGRVLRGTLDQLYDGQHTGRYRWDQLMKTERTHCGTLVEINLQREFAFEDGQGGGEEGEVARGLDFTIAGHQVDCKYSQKFGGWMIPTEAREQLCMLVNADDSKSTWSLGVIRARNAWLNQGKNRDAKVTIASAHRDKATWLHRDAALPPNILLHLPEQDRDAIFAKSNGQQRLDELFRRALGERISRGVVATVAQQKDYMKRVRGNGGSRTRLAPEGIVLLGDSRLHRSYAAALGAQMPEAGETVALRVVPSEISWLGPRLDISGGSWRVAGEEDPVVHAPDLPNPRVAVGASD